MSTSSLHFTKDEILRYEACQNSTQQLLEDLNINTMHPMKLALTFQKVKEQYVFWFCCVKWECFFLFFINSPVFVWVRGTGKYQEV